MIDRILSHVDYSKERIRMRRVCRCFRDVIDHQTTIFDRISVSILDGSIQIDTSEYSETYIIKNTGYRHQNNDDWQRESSDKGWHHLNFILQNPRIKINEFHVTALGRSYISKLDPILNALNHQIHVRSLELPAIRFIQYFKPGVLQRIHFNLRRLQNLEELYRTEQWKLAGYRQIEAEFPCEFPILLKMISQINAFVVTRQTFIPAEIVRIREAIFQSPNFERGSISTKEHYSRIDFAPIKAALGPSFSRSQNDPETCFYRKPGSNESLEFMFLKYAAKIIIRKSGLITV